MRRLVLGICVSLLASCTRVLLTPQRDDEPAAETGGELVLDEGPPRTPPRGKHRVHVDRTASEIERDCIQVLMQRTEEIRGLRFVRPLDVRVQSRDVMADAMRTMQWEDEDTEGDYAQSLALGMVERKTTLAALVDEAAKEEVLGYYEPKHDVLVLRDDVADSLRRDTKGMINSEYRGVIVHELTHALQDQHFDLAALRARRRTTDERLAFMALAEGDALLAELQHQLIGENKSVSRVLQDPAKVQRLMDELPARLSATGLSTSPALLPGAFQYISGVLFTSELWRLGGSRKLDRAFMRAPNTTEEVLDPYQYLSRDKRPALRLPPLPSLDRAGYRVVREDTLGRIMLGVYLSREATGGDMTAASWLGDRLRVFERRGRYAAVWVIKMGSPEGADAVAARATDFDRADFGKEHSPNALTDEVDDHLLAFTREDYAVIARPFEPQLHAQLRAALASWIDTGKVLE